MRGGEDRVAERTYTHERGEDRAAGNASLFSDPLREEKIREKTEQSQLPWNRVRGKKTDNKRKRRTEGENPPFADLLSHKRGGEEHAERRIFYKPAF